MPKRNMGYYRAQRKKAINRKKRIIRDQHNYWNVRFDGELSKGKIHCSCPLCRRKSYDYAKMQDIRNNASAISSLIDVEMDIDIAKYQSKLINKNKGLDF